MIRDTFEEDWAKHPKNYVQDQEDARVLDLIARRTVVQAHGCKRWIGDQDMVKYSGAWLNPLSIVWGLANNVNPFTVRNPKNTCVLKRCCNPAHIRPAAIR